MPNRPNNKNAEKKRKKRKKSNLKFSKSNYAVRVCKRYSWKNVCLLSGSPPFCPRHLLGRVDSKKRQKECTGHRDLVFLPFPSRVRGLCFFLCVSTLKTVESRTGGRRCPKIRERKCKTHHLSICLKLSSLVCSPFYFFYFLLIYWQGDLGVGKSCLLRQFLDKKCIPKHPKCVSWNMGFWSDSIFFWRYISLEFVV
jgi:hypothetical protein